MLKLMAALCMILGGAGIGYAGSRELTEREKNLEILLQILFLLKGEIRCGNSSLSEAFGEIAGKIEGSFSKILLDAAQEMRGSGGSNLTEILEHCIQKIFICKILPELRRMKKELRYCRHWEEDLDISTENSRYVRSNF